MICKYKAHEVWMRSEDSVDSHKAYLGPLGWGPREWRLGAKSEPEMPIIDTLDYTSMGEQ